MDLTDYTLKIVKGKVLTKNQRLALEIIDWCEIPKQYQGFWWRVCKKFPEFTEDRLTEIKHRGIKNSTYLKKMIFK